MASKWLYFTKYGRKKKGQIPSIDLRARTSPQVKRRAVHGQLTAFGVLINGNSTAQLKFPIYRF